LDSMGVREQLQVDIHDNGSVILEESWAIIEVIAIDIQDNPIMGNEIQSAPIIIGTKLSTLENEVYTTRNFGFCNWNSVACDTCNCKFV
jgi:hypothetical protein